MEVIPALDYYKIGLIPWSPIGMGLLGGAFDQLENGRRTTPPLKERITQHQEQLKKYEFLCKEIGEEPSVVALVWLL